MLYIDRIRIKDVRCFADVDIRLNLEQGNLPWGVFVGDNGSGKTALLRSIAMGVCDESSAAGLMKEAAAGYIRRGKRKATIILDLRRARGYKTYQIQTTIEKVAYRNGSYERLRQKTVPAKKFPWNDIFVSAYGAGRGTGGTGDIAEYSSIDAVYNLFNYGEGLQNPELTIRRLQKTKVEAKIRSSLETFLDTGKISFTGQGVKVDGDWGDGMPLRDLADGYKATFLWVADFLGWALSYYSDWESPEAVEGVLFIDELEQHLHATWQRSIVHRLKELFPRVQVLTTTHSPLIASSVGSLGADTAGSGDKLFLLEGRPVDAHEIPHMRGDRVDQVLASRSFKYLVEADPGVEELLQKASVLAEKGDSRSGAEERRYAELQAKIGTLNLDTATAAVKRQEEREYLARLKELVGTLEKSSGGSVR